MSKLVQRAAALVVMVAVTMGATVWGVSSTTIHYKNIQSDAPVVMTVNGEEVRADEYAGMVYNYMQYYANMYASFGLTDVWNNEEFAPALGEMAQTAAYNQVIAAHVVKQEFDEAGLQLSYAQQKELKSQVQDPIDQYGEELYNLMLAQSGFTPDLYSNMAYVSACYQVLEDYYYGENGVNNPTDEELLAQLKETYPEGDAIAAEHILIALNNQMTGETRTNEEAKAAAQEVLDRLNAGENFEDVMNEVSEDPGLASYPNGYIFVEGQMLQPFYEAAIALKEGEVSGLVETTEGYHIIKRVPVDYEGQLDVYHDELVAAMGATMDNLFTEWLDGADVQTTDTYDQITWENVQDYLPAEVQDTLTAAAATTEQSEQAAEEDAAADAEAEQDAAGADAAADAGTGQAAGAETAAE